MYGFGVHKTTAVLGSLEISSDSLRVDASESAYRYRYCFGVILCYMDLYYFEFVFLFVFCI